ncbi:MULTISPECIES: hypothetical protein [Myxococcus]|uniref:Lipoprotein n=1 Tax=Myxococcus llanfairpwllgwyngyllgogerychwyrndrobwllllantysiliogogogochensis TaxID=2590453 RepID=A0A540X7J7_9BACT|nr:MULTISPECIES: hypothetical protein [Myxococcus]NTX05522.1 hypothetical protein [Myxococcus sp. CA040A]TQF17217.1 hypothetical protein FJV41_04615 [Myxococcus llanfairpwllgwyngyllgogerychwyrndrobwllllantysiliogogogochensis]
MRMRMLLASALLVLGGCGGDDDKEGDDGDDTTTDHRSNVTGAYESTGTLSATFNGETQTGELDDTVRISEASGSKTALSLRSESLTCDRDLRATMTGENTFFISEGACSVFDEESKCTADLSVTSGRGSREPNGPLQLTLQGKFTVRCSPLPIVGDFTLLLTGTRTGAEALPRVETRLFHVTHP